MAGLSEMRPCRSLTWILLLLFIGGGDSLFVTNRTDDLDLEDGNDINFFGCEDGFLYIPEADSCYWVSDSKVNWDEAKEECDSLGATLAVFESQEEFNIVKEIVNQPVWIGLNDKKTEGQQLNSSSWARKQSDNYQDEDCIGLQTFSYGKLLKGFPCTTSLQFLCKKDHLQPRTKRDLSSRTPCSRGFTYVRELNSCYLLDNFRATWHEARNRCKQRGGDLAIISSLHEQEKIAPLTTEKAWIGLSDIKKEGQFMWVDGSPLGFSSFASKQPDNYNNNEDCIEVSPSFGLNWNDIPCNLKRKFFCEQKPLQRPTKSNIGAGIPCIPGYTYVPEIKSCYRLYNLRLTWHGARDRCKISGGTLAIIDSFQEHKVIASRTNERTWIGLSDIAKEGNYVWEDGSPFIFSSFANNQPDNYYNEDCIEIANDFGFNWNDIPCNTKRKFFCEQKPLPPVSEEDVNAGIPCLPGYSYVSKLDSCYSLNHIRANWHEARKRCLSSGGILALIKSPLEQKIIAPLTDERTYIGLSDTRREGTYVWEDGSSLKFSSFNILQPDNFLFKEDCIEVAPDFNFNWNDICCSTERKYLCEHTPNKPTIKMKAKNPPNEKTPMQEESAHQKLSKKILVLKESLDTKEEIINSLTKKLEDAQNKLKETRTECQDDLKNTQTECEDELKNTQTECQNELKNTQTKCQDELKNTQAEFQDELKNTQTECQDELKKTQTKCQVDLKNTQTECQDELKNTRAEFQGELKNAQTECQDELKKTQTKCQVDLKNTQTECQDKLKNKETECQRTSNGNIKGTFPEFLLPKGY